MNCMNCGAVLSDIDLDYCPSCGSNVLIQKKVDYLSKYYYNQGLEKASIRDLSGAITCLKQSLAFNKRNIQARNLLGLVYFETGEVVSALSEWVISKNLQPSRNLASEYIDKLQANPARLEAINETIKKYNHALQLCREGHEDMAAIQLRKILSQNSKLIKGYHLLALIQIKEQEWGKVRRTLRRAIRIDKTNTTTLRFLKEVDERTGVATKLERQNRGIFRGTDNVEENVTGTDYVVNPPVYRERRRISVFVTLTMGIAVGVSAFWLLAVPAIKQRIYREANHQIVKYSESLSSQGAQLSRAQGEAREVGDAVEATVQQLELEKVRSSSYEALLKAYSAVYQENYDEAALVIQTVHAYLLPDDVRWMYTTVCNTTGVTGIEEPEGSEDEEGASGDSGGDSSYDDGYSDSGYDDGYSDSDYDDSYNDGGYDDSYSDGGYDDGYSDSGYDDGYSDSGYDDSYSDSDNDYGYGDSGYDDGSGGSGYDDGYSDDGSGGSDYDNSDDDGTGGGNDYADDDGDSDYGY